MLHIKMILSNIYSSLNYLINNTILFNCNFSLNNGTYSCGKTLSDFFEVDSNNKEKNRFTSEYRKNHKLTLEQEEALIGIMLGDGYLERKKSTHNTRLCLEQAYPKNENYLFSLFDLFKSLTISRPKVIIRKPDKRTNKFYKSIAFKTSAMFCLNKYHELFYKDKIKIVPKNIHELLTARGLAYWIMDDGGIGFYNQTILHTRAFTKEDLFLLQNALKLNFKLKTRLEMKKENQWVIIIPVKQEVPLKDIVEIYMHSDMTYKINV